MKLDSYLSWCTKINSIWIRDLKIRHELLKHLGGGATTDKTLQNRGTGKVFLKKAPVAQEIISRIDRVT